MHRQIQISICLSFLIGKIGGENNPFIIGLTEFTYKLMESREGNGTPLQFYCLENPMDGGAWWAAVYGHTESDMTEAT